MACREVGLWLEVLVEQVLDRLEVLLQMLPHISSTDSKGGMADPRSPSNELFWGTERRLLSRCVRRAVPQKVSTNGPELVSLVQQRLFSETSFGLWGSGRS